jgi:hypothetical protein
MAFGSQITRRIIKQNNRADFSLLKAAAASAAAAAAATL